MDTAGASARRPLASTTQRPVSRTGETSAAAYAGGSPGGADDTHICTSRAGPSGPARSECVTPAPALSACTHPVLSTLR